jgi:hypothetical protein
MRVVGLNSPHNGRGNEEKHKDHKDHADQGGGGGYPCHNPSSKKIEQRSGQQSKIAGRYLLKGRVLTMELSQDIQPKI